LKALTEYLLTTQDLKDHCRHIIKTGNRYWEKETIFTYIIDSKYYYCFRRCR